MKLTKPQRDALERLLRGPEFWCSGKRTGGATGRMLDRMAREGLITTAPHYVTDAGRKVLASYAETVTTSAEVPHE